jgi:hypothetical protein
LARNFTPQYRCFRPWWPGFSDFVMSHTKTPRLYVDWWFIQKKFIYLGITGLAIAVLAAGAAMYVWAYGNPLRNVGKMDNLTTGARFVSFEGDVRVIRASTRETIVPASDTRLYPGDTVQTQADGRARISMVDGSVVVVRPNSTVIIRDNTSSEGGQRTNVRVALDDGQINVRTEDQSATTTNVVETHQTENRLNAQTEGSFGVNPDTKADEIRISTGSVETTTSSGEKSTVKAGEYVAVNQAGTVAKREKLLNIPTPSEPADLTKVFAGPNGSAGVILRWQRPQTGAAAFYRVEVATSPFFVQSGKVSERDQLSSTELAVNDLRSGNYFWRVRATAPSGQVSDWSDPRKFSVAPHGNGSRVEISELKAELVGGSIYLITGQAPPGTTLRAAGRETIAGNDGRFQLQVMLSGTAEVSVEARDPDGNASHYGISLSSGRVAKK